MFYYVLLVSTEKVNGHEVIRKVAHLKIGLRSVITNFKFMEDTKGQGSAGVLCIEFDKAHSFKIIKNEVIRKVAPLEVKAEVRYYLTPNFKFMEQRTGQGSAGVCCFGQNTQF